MTLEDACRLLDTWMRKKSGQVAAQKAALDHYGKYFAPANLKNITVDGFKGFLLIKNNRHWAGIHRQAGIYADFEKLWQCLAILLDEKEPIEKRLDTIIPKDRPPMIRGLGRAVLTPILMCVCPDRYAVYNRISDEGLTMLGRNPIRQSDPFSARYAALNRACHEISAEIGQPLYLIDSMFSLMVHGVESPLEGSSQAAPGAEPESVKSDSSISTEEQQPSGGTLSFTLEKHLQEFLLSNWEKTALGKCYALHTEDEESGAEYPTAVGEIDILARDKTNGDWVVIELKRGRESDKVVGQLLRYMGWIKKNKAGAGERVRGIIITSASDDRIKYAVSIVPDITFFTYRVSFDLTPEQPV